MLLEGPAQAGLAGLAASLSPGSLSLETGQRTTYAHDESQFAAWATPLAVVRARSVDDVRETVRFAAVHGLAVVPQGARTGLAGGANATEGSVVLSLERMDAILDIDPLERTATVEPGVVNAVLSRAVATHGLFYPPDPGSWETSTIGGNVATNAGGLCCVKYGATADYVRALQVVLADGEVIRTGRRTRKGVVGYDLTRLFTGSEGTLGVITEITVQLVAQPEVPVTVVACFSAMDDAIGAVHDIARARLSPSLLELMDGVTLRAVDDRFGLDLPSDAAAMLVAQHDGASSAQAAFVRDVSAVFSARRATDIATGETAQENDALLVARRNAHFAGEALGGMLTDDVCVPLSVLSELVTGVTRLADDAALTVTFLGHAGDGNIHTTVIYRRDDAEEKRRAYELSLAIAALALDLGGTISGEHGIGLLKREMMRVELGSAVMDLHARLKAVLDPHHLLNPGKVLGPLSPSTGAASSPALRCQQGEEHSLG